MQMKNIVEKIVPEIIFFIIIGLGGMWISVEKIKDWKQLVTAKILEQDDVIDTLSKDVFLLNDRIKEIDKKLDEDKYIKNEVNKEQMDQIRDEIIDERIDELHETVKKLKE